MPTLNPDLKKLFVYVNFNADTNLTSAITELVRVSNEQYKDRIFFYEPRNIEALKSVVNISTKYKQRGLVAVKNTEEYYQNFMQFVTKSKFGENQDGV